MLRVSYLNGLSARKAALFGVRYRVAAFCFAVVLLQVGMASAQSRHSQEDLRSLPRVCLAQKFINSNLMSPIVPEVERKQWAARMGEGYIHFHHYCWGLIDLRRAARAEREVVRGSAYRRAVKNFQYVQSNAPPSFSMMPEVYLRKGMALQLLGQHGKAAREFLGAIQLKADYTPAYAALVDLYMELDDTDAAVAILDRGLEHAPNSSLLAQKKTAIERRNESRRE